MRLHELRATRPGRVPVIRMSGQLIPGEHVTSLNLWVDGHGVVRQIDATLAAPRGGPRTTVSVNFTDIGRPQTVRAPAGTLPVTFLAEIGFAVAFGVLLDTIVVRSVLVTALNLDLGRWMWWPGKLARPPRAQPGSSTGHSETDEDRARQHAVRSP